MSVILCASAFMGIAHASASACLSNPVFNVTLNAYIGQYEEAEKGLKAVEQKRGQAMASFLRQVLLWKQGFEAEDTQKQAAAMALIDQQIATLQEKQEASNEEKRLSVAMMIHAARMHLAMSHIFTAAKLGARANDLLTRIRDKPVHQNQRDQGALKLAAGLYQYYAGALANQSSLLSQSWLRGLLSLEGDQAKGRELIEQAALSSNDFSFEAARSLIDEVKWNKPRSCRYLAWFEPFEAQLYGSLSFPITQIGLQLFCGQGQAALANLARVDARLESKKLSANDQQKDWLMQAKFHAQAQAADVSKLKAALEQAQKSGDKKRAALAQFALGKAYDIKLQAALAKVQYEAVLKSKLSSKYKNLAKQYKAVAYRAPLPVRSSLGDDFKFDCVLE